MSYNYEEATGDIEESNMSVSLDDIKKLYLKSDEAIDWTELLVSASAMMCLWSQRLEISEKHFAKYYRDIDAYLNY